jgi:hypothetical protein
MPVGRLLLIVNGAAIVASMVVVATRRREPSRFLIDADRTYGLKSLLVSGFEFGQQTGRADAASRARSGAALQREAFETLVIEKAETTTDEIDPGQVYPAKPPRRLGVLAALVVALGILAILDASGWFDRPQAPFAGEAMMLEDAGRRLAERAQDNEELQQLADEMRRLGEQVRRNRIEPDAARRRAGELEDRVEEQMRNLERTPPFEQGENAEIPEDAEDTIRRALESGMGEGEVVEFFTRMRSEGNTVPEVIDALEEATPDRAPDTNLGVDEEQMQELMDQLNRPPPSENAENAESGQNGASEELAESRRALAQMGADAAELSEGEGEQAGEAESGGAGAGGDSSPQPDESGEPGEGETDGGQEGGTLEVDDAMDDDFRRAEDSSPVFRELKGIVTDNTIMDIIIRELPSEATSELTETERQVVFERIVEEAVNREDTPPELQRLVRNYFLRLTLAAEQGAQDEQ